MLSGEGNAGERKTTIGLISEKATLHVDHAFGTFLFRRGRLRRETA